MVGEGEGRKVLFKAPGQPLGARAFASQSQSLYAIEWHLVAAPFLGVELVQLLLLLHAVHGLRQRLGDVGEGGHARGVARGKVTLLLIGQLHPIETTLVDFRLQGHQLPAEFTNAPA